MIYFRMLKTTVASDVFTSLENPAQKELIANFSNKEINSIVEELYTDEIVDIIEEMPSAISKKIYRSIKNPEERTIVNRLLKYNDDQVGSIMAVNIIWLDERLSCQEALEKIRELRHISEITSHFFITDRLRHVVGKITFEDLFFENDGNRSIKELSTPVKILKTTQSTESASLLFAKHDLPVLPVVNSEGILVGMLTADDVIDILQEESKEDAYKSAGISTGNTIDIPYRQLSVFAIAKSRLF